MNRLSRKISLGLVGLVVPFSFLAVSSSASLAATTPKTSPFCTNLLVLVTKINSSVSSLEAKMATARTNRDQKVATNDTKWDQELATDRAKWTGQRQDQFTRLEAKATTDTQKAAVKTYETTITSAIATRESANDAARATFRAGVASLIAGQRSTIDSQVGTFANAVSSAEATALSSCQATPDQGPAIRTAFQTAMKNARQAFVSDRKSDGTIGSQVKALAQTRDAAFKVNDATFVAAAKAAAAALKTAFKNPSI